MAYFAEELISEFKCFKHLILKIILKERQERKQQRLQENAVSPAFASDDAQDIESSGDDQALEQADPSGTQFCWYLHLRDSSVGGSCAQQMSREVPALVPVWRKPVCCAPGMQKFSGSHLNNQRTPLWQVGPLTTPLRDTVRPPGLICVELVGPLWPAGVVASGHCYMASKHMKMSGGGGHLGVPTLGPLEAGWLWQCDMHVYV